MVLSNNQTFPKIRKNITPIGDGNRIAAYQDTDHNFK